jgi:hypothetical protein
MMTSVKSANHVPACQEVSSTLLPSFPSVRLVCYASAPHATASLFPRTPGNEGHLPDLLPTVRRIFHSATPQIPLHFHHLSAKKDKPVNPD